MGSMNWRTAFHITATVMSKAYMTSVCNPPDEPPQNGGINPKNATKLRGNSMIRLVRAVIKAGAALLRHLKIGRGREGISNSVCNQLVKPINVLSQAKAKKMNHPPMLISNRLSNLVGRRFRGASDFRADSNDALTGLVVDLFVGRTSTRRSSAFSRSSAVQ